MNIIHNTKKL